MGLLWVVGGCCEGVGVAFVHNCMGKDVVIVGGLELCVWLLRRVVGVAFVHKCVDDEEFVYMIVCMMS